MIQKENDARRLFDGSYSQEHYDYVRKRHSLAKVRTAFTEWKGGSDPYAEDVELAKQWVEQAPLEQQEAFGQMRSDANQKLFFAALARVQLAHDKGRDEAVKLAKEQFLVAFGRDVLLRAIVPKENNFVACPEGDACLDEIVDGYVE